MQKVSTQRFNTTDVVLFEQPTVPNDFGTFNNVISVNTTDFEVFEALGKDCLETGHLDDPNCRSYGMYDLNSPNINRLDCNKSAPTATRLIQTC